MFVSNPVRDKVTCDTYSKLHFHGVMTKVCKHTKNHTWELCVNTNTCTHTNAIHVNCIHTHTPCVRVRKHQYLHTHWKHIRKQDTNTDMYACICIHTLYVDTQCLFIHIFIDVHTYTRTYKPRYVYIYLHAHTLHLYVPTCPFTYIYTYIYTPIHTCTNTDMYACIYTHVYIDVSTYTHTCGCGAHVCQYIHTYM